MARIVGMVAMSHSPSWDLQPISQGSGAVFVTAVAEARATVERIRPDAMIVFGPDHFRNFFYDVLPPFCIGVETIEGFGDYSSAKGPLPCAAALGRAIIDYVMDAGFDPAVSLHMSVDHGITQPYQAIDKALTTPIVPIMVNGSGAPRPSFRRCWEFGRAVGAAVAAIPEDLKIIAIGSGGLSHFLPAISADDAGITAETRDYVINGRPRAREYNEMRERSSFERRKKAINGRISEDWDRWFLARMTAGDLEPLFALTPAEIDEQAGNGAQELRAWFAALGAWGGPVKIACYEPVPTWVTGMGCVTGFAA